MNDTFLKACRRQKTPYTPVWLMRQAGRYMKEYMAIKEKYSFLEMCGNPEIACEVTLQPIKAFELDAAIIFADILLPLPGMGIKLQFAKGDGPVIGNPVRTKADIENIRIIEPLADVPYLLEAIKLVKRELNGKLPLIGFSGAPFTIASYIIEGGGSRNYVHAKKLMYSEPRQWHDLMKKITEIIIRYLKAQVDSGVDALQLFDSWVGCLAPDDYNTFVLPHNKKIFAALKKYAPNVPFINFSTNTGTYLELCASAGGDVVGLDWKVRLAEAWKRVGYNKAVQGNLDPTVLFGTRAEIRKRAKAVLAEANGRKGHIFNLGHGIILGTPVDNVRTLIDSVHEFSSR